ASGVSASLTMPATRRDFLARRRAQTTTPARATVRAPTTAFGHHAGVRTNARTHATRMGMPSRSPIFWSDAGESGSGGSCLARWAARSSSRIALGSAFFFPSLAIGASLALPGSPVERALRDERPATRNALGDGTDRSHGTNRSDRP